MTRYYIGYEQGDNDYVYLANIVKSNIGVTVIIEEAISFDTVELAKGVFDYVNNAIANQEFKILKVTTKIEEVK